MSDSIKDLQARVVAFREQRNWRESHGPKNLALGLMIEAGELAELFLWKEGEDFSEFQVSGEARNRLMQEIADVQIFLFYFAEACDIPIGDAVLEKIRLNGLKYPLEENEA